MLVKGATVDIINIFHNYFKDTGAIAWSSQFQVSNNEKYGEMEHTNQFKSNAKSTDMFSVCFAAS